MMTSSSPNSYFFYCHGDHRDLHSFPTRRSSDLRLPLGSTWVTTAATLVCSASCRFTEPLPSLEAAESAVRMRPDRKSTRLNSSHMSISYAVFCLKKKMQVA